ncbi:Zn(II)2Cys6 transcription factor [Penicillium riverlandense]|uniref:Zn(II)2Cys6 transcription factor n=1 Tax=Penicillium riverlandense TaxID=1903569 RepID=UPI002547562D|nr:Zn(II)2Cys6 transcription factor [Penicillium riverlandense]KAJ5814929.1 Zn(II)2Cys6 transcription factor [Penicillium riverlandense]
MGGMFPYIRHLLGTDPSPALQAAIKAIGLASMSNTRMSAELMRAARQEYSTALLATNRALQDRIQFKSDSTLAAVMLLSMYETITCRSPDLMGRWMSHVQGATKLIEMRGAQQLQTPTGLQLFSQIRIQITLGHIFYKQYAPPVVVQLSKEAAAHRDSGLEKIEDFFDILVQVSNLSAEIRANASRGSSFGNPAPFIQKALQLDIALVSWATSINPACPYTTVSALYTKKHDYDYRSVYGESYHVYPNVEIASLWNNYRLTRIIIHEIIGSIYVRLLKPGGPPEDRLMALRSIAISRQMAEDICSSVPYHFNSGDVAIGSAFRLIWPLYVASDCVGSAPTMKQWIVRTLEKIGQATGVQQALTMSQLVKRETELQWLSRELDKMEGNIESV